MLIRIFSAILFVLIIAACGNRQAKKSQAPLEKEAKKEAVSFTLAAPNNGDKVSWGDTLTISYAAVSDSINVDSSAFFINNNWVASYHKEPMYKWVVPQNTKVGSTPVAITIWHNGGKLSKLSSTVKVHPPIPIFYDYELVNTYPHDTAAYTQGLFYHNGFLYEGTGQNGKSTLRRVELRTGEVLKSVALEKEYFGEGITLLNNKIYQLTWESRKGFVYDAGTFERIGEFTYATEGWGLTTDGKYLIMSDGSSIIRFLDPETFKEVRHIEVYTNKGAIIYLNELEYINGEIWANVYTQDTVISINPETGQVTRIVDMRNLLPANLHTANTDVLNGIAYDKGRNGNLYVTGKNWPKLYEIKLIQRKYEK